MKKCYWVKRSILFFLILIMIFTGLCFLFQPIWISWSNYDTTFGFYREPQNTLEVIFLGASITANAIIPMELYRDYGICAYNLGLEQQPMLASYYWIEETYRLHKDTLKTVVVDMSLMRRTPLNAFYRKSIDNMALSPVKFRAVRDFSTSWNETLSYLIPLFQYHERWTSLEKSDFMKGTIVPEVCLRGYNFSTKRNLDKQTYDNIVVPEYFIDDSADEPQLDESALYYLNRMMTFCNEHGLNLILMKTPAMTNWSSGIHNAIQKIADRYGLIYLDFNYEPYLNEIGYNHALDCIDGQHLNYSGARKFTSYMGQYLIDHQYVTDVRKNPRYDFMKKELSDYECEVLSMIEVKQITELQEFLETVISNENNTVFIVVKDEAANALTDETREFLKEKGLTVLSELSFRNSYYGVIDSGAVITEATKVYYEDDEEIAATVVNDPESARLIKNNDEEEILTIFTEGILQDGTIYRLESGGYTYGKKASCILNGTEYAQNGRGLNIIVYDKTKHEVLDAAWFDTYISESRDPWFLDTVLKQDEENHIDFNHMSPKLQKLYLYNMRCFEQYHISELHRNLDEDGAWQFIRAYCSKPDTRILIAVQNEASGTLNDSSRKAFAELGLKEFASIRFRDSYIGIIENGNVVYEMKDHGEQPINVSNREYAVISGGYDSGKISSIVISETDYSQHKRGMNIAIYDIAQKKVIDTALFDIYATEVNLKPIYINWEEQR